MMENNNIKDIKWSEWLKAKGLKSERWPKSDNELLPIFLAEKGFNEDAIKGLIDYQKAKEVKWTNLEKGMETYTPVVITVGILLANNIMRFLSTDWERVIFFILGIEILVIFIKNTVKKAVKEAKKD